MVSKEFLRKSIIYQLYFRHNGKELILYNSINYLLKKLVKNITNTCMYLCRVHYHYLLSLECRVFIPEVGYVTTPICMVQAAVVVLKEKEKLPGK